MTTVDPQLTEDHGREVEDENTWSVVRRELRRAPRDSRRRVWWALFGFVLTLAVVALDALTGSGGLEPYRLFAVTLAGAAFLLLAVANTLYVLGESSAAGSATVLEASLPRFNRMLSVLPVLTLAAALLLAAASGIFLPSLSASMLFLLPTVIFLTFAVLAARETARTSRFLYRHALRQEHLAERAEGEATRARLATLQAQLNPHFLFNALNTIASLVRTDARGAERTVENLADVLRRTLARSERPLTTVRDEIEYLQAYLAIEEQRWGNSLRIEWGIEPDTLDIAVPSMILQPLVENALKHGLGQRVEGGWLRVEVSRADGIVKLGVSDDGAGFPARHIEGTGLGNLRRRLETLYGEKAELRISSEHGVSMVDVLVPLKATI